MGRLFSAWEASATWGRQSTCAGKAPVLYTEADGLYVRLQRETKGGKKQKHYELKNAIAYEGWERLSQKAERYRLMNKRVYCHSGVYCHSDGGSSSIPFWDGAGLAWNKHWDLEYSELMVLGGGDAYPAQLP